MFFRPWRRSTESLPNPSRSSDQLKIPYCYQVRKRATEPDRHTGRIVGYGDHLAFFVGHRISNFVTNVDTHRALLQPFPRRLTQRRGSSEMFSGYPEEIRKCVN